MKASRLAVELTSQIGTSPVVAGMRLPSINELGLKYKVSPATALKAVKTLESKGLVECIRGRGEWRLDKTFFKVARVYLTRVSRVR